MSLQIDLLEIKEETMKFFENNINEEIKRELRDKYEVFLEKLEASLLKWNMYVRLKRERDEISIALRHAQQDYDQANKEVKEDIVRVPYNLLAAQVSMVKLDNTLIIRDGKRNQLSKIEGRIEMIIGSEIGQDNEETNFSSTIYDNIKRQAEKYERERDDIIAKFPAI